MAAPDVFVLHAVVPDGPALDFAAVTKSDTVDLPFKSRWLWVGGAGDVSVLAADETTAVLFSSVPAGTRLPIRTSRVRATGTTATNIVAMK